MIAWLARRLCGKNTPVVVAAVILLVLLSGCSAGLATKPAQRVTVFGQLSDHYGRPISGWYVRFEGRYDVGVTTDSSGRYSASLVEGRYVAFVLAPWYRVPIAQQIDVSRGHTEFDFRYDSYRVSGRLLGPLGSVIDSGYVSASSQEQTIYENETIVAGTFSLILPAGDYRFGAFAKDQWSGYPARSISVPVRGDTTFDIALIGDPITGTVRGPGGVLLSGVSVQASGQHAGAAALTGLTGQYTLFLPPDSYRFSLNGPSYILPRITTPYAVAGPSQLDFDLSGTHWSGTVRFAAINSPVAGAVLTAQLFADAYHRAAIDTTDAGGGFDLFLEPGREYLLSVSGPGLADQPAISIIAGADTTFDIPVDLAVDYTPKP